LLWSSIFLVWEWIDILAAKHQSGFFGCVGPQHPQNCCMGCGILWGKKGFRVVGGVKDVFLVVLVVPLALSELLWWAVFCKARVE